MRQVAEARRLRARMKSEPVGPEPGQNAQLLLQRERIRLRRRPLRPLEPREDVARDDLIDTRLLDHCPLTAARRTARMVGTVSVAGRSTQRRPIGLGRSRLRRDLAMIEFSGPTGDVGAYWGALASVLGQISDSGPRSTTRPSASTSGRQRRRAPHSAPVRLSLSTVLALLLSGGPSEAIEPRSNWTLPEGEQNGVHDQLKEKARRQAPDHRGRDPLHRVGTGACGPENRK